MIIQILSVGESKNPYLKEGVSDFIQRLKHYCRLEIRTVKEEKILKNQCAEFVQKSEAKRIFDQLNLQSKIIALDERGELISSMKLSTTIQHWENQSTQRAVFIIGGPLGLHDSVIQKADWTLSLSRMTFTHEMARMLLLEQIYRAYTILRGEKYHK